MIWINTNTDQPRPPLHIIASDGELREIADVTLFRSKDTGGAWMTVDLNALAGELSAALESVKAGGFDTVGECLRIADAAAEIAGAS